MIELTPHPPDPATVEALARVDAFIARHPDMSRIGVEQPGQGATNRVVFAARTKDASRLVFKVFCTAERKARETFALRHWAETGLVPRLLHNIDERTIAMSYVPGAYLHTSRETDTEIVWLRSCQAAGTAAASLVEVPLAERTRSAFEARFYGGLGPLAAYATRILTLGRGITARDPDFSDAFWTDSLAFIIEQLPALLCQPQRLYHQDVSNLHVREGHFSGFFDLEMCRIGGAAMQLGSALSMFIAAPEGWSSFIHGWELISGALSSAERCATAAARHLLAWREISRYMSYDGTPGSGHDWASPADPRYYRQEIRATHDLLDV